MMDWKFMLPSKLIESPIPWMLLADGMMLDIRYCPADVQEEAFRRGMIPFVPGDRK